MKKTRLTLAALGVFAGAASAQSSVSIYGSVDMAISKGNGGTAVATGGNGTSQAWQVKQSHGSRLGFYGNEDLGGGLSAQLLLEHRFSPDTGASTTSTFWQAGSFVQLTHEGLGAVYLGRWYSPSFWVALKVDPFTWDGVGAVSIMQYPGYLTPVGAAYTNNTIGYKTPNWGGFTANLALGLSEGDPAVSRTDGLNLEYTQGAIYAGLGYERNKGGPATAATNGDGASMVNAAFSYNFGFIRPMAYFAVAKGMDGFNLSTFAARPDQKNTMWNVGFTAPAGIGVIKAVYGVRTYEQYVYNLTNDSIEQTKLGLGYDYFLSKRTRLYADYTRNTEDRKTNNTAFALGMRHDF